MITAHDKHRFFSKVDKLPSGCWLWIGARSKGKGNRKPYGSFHYNGKSYRAHVWAHDKLAGKAFVAGQHRDHLCNNSLCVNPDHIHAVSPQLNEERKQRRRKCASEQATASSTPLATSMIVFSASRQLEPRLLLSAIA